MTDRFQFIHTDGGLDWSVGNSDFEVVWDNAFDLLRFHKGRGFTVDNKANPKQPQEMKLGEVHDWLKPKIASNPPDTRFRIESVKDGYGVVMRRHEFADPEAVQQEMAARELIGTPYVFGFHDCSWLTLHTVNLVEPSILLPHKATLQMQDSRVVHIARDKVKPMDLLFHWGDENGVDHVSLYLDANGPGGNGRVIDTEPHDTGSPSGWPTGTLGTGVRIRPMNPGYYCDWAHVVAIGRIEAINGKP